MVQCKTDTKNRVERVAGLAITSAIPFPLIHANGFLIDSLLARIDGFLTIIDVLIPDFLLFFK